jgi:1A family penicillin-binding protein
VRRAMLVGAVAGVAAVFWIGLFWIAGFTLSFAREMEQASSLAHFRPRPQATLVYDRYGDLAFSIYAERRTDVSFEGISPHMIAAIVAVEDRRFYSHYGVDPLRIVAAAWRNARAGRIREGGSTITQQLARAAQLSPARTFERKIKEALIALRLEERYTKERILAEYLNTVYFGDGFYGVEAASRGYFGKTAGELEPAEGALLAALVRSPSLDAPSVSPERAKRRRNLVLTLMQRQGRISPGQLTSALATDLPGASVARDAVNRHNEPNATGGYFEAELRRELFDTFGVERVLRGGLQVHSTYDPRLQAAAEEAVATRVEQLRDRRRPIADLQGALVALDPRTGDVLALVGGRDFAESPFNRATQAHRQPGSAFKPIVYAAALEHGYAPGTLLQDLDVPDESFENGWMPSGEHEERIVTLRRALKLSSNRAAVRLLQDVGIGATLYYAQRLGIDSALPRVPSLALGTGEVTLLELTAAYGAFANQGRLTSPHLIRRIDDARGVTIWRAPGAPVQALRPMTAFLMSSMLADVVSSGTATAVRAAGFKLPAAGKTGTSDDYTDAWFIGYTPQIVAGVWFGADNPTPIMKGGFAGVVAVPAWARFMRVATDGQRAEWFPTPNDVEKVAICRRSGSRATPACIIPDPADYSRDLLVRPVGTIGDLRGEEEIKVPLVYEDLFPVGSVTEMCPLHGGSESLGHSVPRPRSFGPAARVP